MHRLLDTHTDIAVVPLAPEAVREGTPQAGSRALAALGGSEIGVWEMTAGVATDVEADEVFVVLSGDGTVEFDDGDRIELRPGVAVRLREGDRTTWTIRTTLRKIYLA